MKFSCVKMAKEVASVVMVRKSTASTKAKTTFSEEETARILSQGREEEVLFKSLHKDYSKNDVSTPPPPPELNSSNNCL